MNDSEYYNRETGVFDLSIMSQEELDKTYEDRYSSGQLTEYEMSAA